MYLSKKITIFYLSIFSVLISPMANAIDHKSQNIIGTWQSYDEKTGNKKVQITFDFDKKTQTYYGRITKITPVYGYKPRTHCTKCAKPFTGMPLMNLTVIWNVKPIIKKGVVRGYHQGYILDPVGGKIYRFKGKVSRSDKILKATAYLGTSLFSRTQNWARVTETKKSDKTTDNKKTSENIKQK